MQVTTKQSFPVHGLNCAGCANTVQKTLERQTGVSAAQVSLTAGKALIEFDSARVSLSQLKDSVQRAGYDLDIQTSEIHSAINENAERRLKELKRNSVGALICATPVVIISMLFHHAPVEVNVLLAVLCAVTLFVFGKELFQKAMLQFRSGDMAMDALVALSTGISFVWSVAVLAFRAQLEQAGFSTELYLESASLIVGFVLLGRYIEERAKKVSTAAIDSLSSMKNDSVFVQRGDQQREIPLGAVADDEVVIVRAGERIAVDGVVEQGRSDVDESMLSGESLPQLKLSGDTVYAGTINQSGSLIVRTISHGSQTLLSHIIRSVEDAQMSKAPVQHLADRISAVFIPIVFAISFIAFVAWWMAGDFTQALNSSITVLVIACPCALGLATPIAVTVAIGRAAQHGILVKEARIFEQMPAVTDIVFDKTGTLTQSKLKVIECIWLNNDANTPLFKSEVVAAESRSIHPFARALREYFAAWSEESLSVDSFEEIPGMGVRASIGDDSIVIGNRSFVEAQISTKGESTAGAHRERGSGASEVFVALNGSLACQLLFRDTLKDDAKSAVGEFTSAKVDTHLLSGDKEQPSTYTAAQLGIAHVIHSATPDSKKEYVQKLRSTGSIVAMAGDGVNDAQALAEADVSIAVSSSEGVVSSAAHALILGNEVRGVNRIYLLSKKTLRVIKQNLWWAFSYNLILIPLAAGLAVPLGLHINPMFGGIAMVLSDVIVVFNSLRLRSAKL